jgi:hypothetical protein
MKMTVAGATVDPPPGVTSAEGINMGAMDFNLEYDLTKINEMIVDARNQKNEYWDPLHAGKPMFCYEINHPYHTLLQALAVGKIPDRVRVHVNHTIDRMTGNQVQYDLDVLEGALQDIAQLIDGDDPPMEMRMMDQACSKHFTRRVQEKLQLRDDRVESALREELPGHGFKMMTDMEGHRVAEKIFELQWQPELTTLLLQEMDGYERRLAEDKFGCRVVQRAIRYSPDGPLRSKLADELLRHIVSFCSHQMAVHVVEALIEFGTKEWRTKVYHDTKGRLQSLAKQKFGSYVVEKLLHHCEEERSNIIDEIMADDSVVTAPSGPAHFVTNKIREIAPDRALPAAPSRRAARQNRDMSQAQASQVQAQMQMQAQAYFFQTQMMAAQLLQAQAQLAASQEQGEEPPSLSPQWVPLEAPAVDQEPHSLDPIKLEMPASLGDSTTPHHTGSKNDPGSMSTMEPLSGDLSSFGIDS